MFIHSPNELLRSPSLVATGQRMREHNAAVLLRMIWGTPEGVSRADLARRSGLSRSTVSTITAELLDDGLITEDRVARSKGGRPPMLLQVCDDQFAVIGLEIGGSHLSCVRTDLRGEVHHHRSEACDVPGMPGATLERIERLIDDALQGLDSPTRQVGIGIAVPCPLDADAPGRLSTRILPGWSEIDLGGHLFDRYGLPVLMDNDANLGALAESWWGSGRGVPHFTYVKVATGIGAGHIIHGEIFRGASGIAGEIGHSMVAQGGRRCRCGLHGCLEAEVGSAAIVEKARERLAANGTTSQLSEGSLTLGAVVDAAVAGDPLATELIREAGTSIGIALANLVNLMNPARIVLGGRLSGAGDLLVRPMRRAMQARALATSVEGSELRVSELSPGAVARGAAALVLQWALDKARVLAPRESTPDSRASTRLLSVQPALR